MYGGVGGGGRFWRTSQDVISTFSVQYLYLALFNKIIETQRLCFPLIRLCSASVARSFFFRFFKGTSLTLKFYLHEQLEGSCGCRTVGAIVGAIVEKAHYSMIQKRAHCSYALGQASWFLFF